MYIQYQANDEMASAFDAESRPAHAVKILMTSQR
jgi:hypothetical protein